MAVVGGTVPTLVDIAKAKDPDGSIADIAELLSQYNPILQDIPWFESNLDTGNRSAIRTDLPVVTKRHINQGVPPSKSTTAQIEDGMSIFETRHHLDVDMPTGGQTAAFRVSEATAAIEAMGQAVAQDFFYGSTLDDADEFNGFAIRYDDLTGNIADNVINAQGPGANKSSIWLIRWGKRCAYGIYPKGSVGGLQHEDLGRQLIQDGLTISGATLLAWVDRFVWKAGLVVKDYRCVVRIANIDMTELSNMSGSQLITAGTNILKLMARAPYRLPPGSTGMEVYYVPRSVAEIMHVMAIEKTAATLTFDNLGGKRVMTYGGIPVRVVDQLIYNEGAVN